MSFVSGDDQVGVCRDCRSQDRVVLGIRGQVHGLRLVEDDGTGVEVLDCGRGFLGVDQVEDSLLVLPSVAILDLADGNIQDVAAHRFIDKP